MSNVVVEENPFNHSGTIADTDRDDRLSTAQKAAPKLSRKTLTWMLVGMVFIPIVTITGLWIYMPAVYEGQLQANVTTEGLPGAAFYQAKYDQRPPFEGGFIVVHNQGDLDWTNLNIQINGYYQIYDVDPIPAGEEKRYQLSKFITRSGDNFKLRYNEFKSVRIYARLPKGDRATFWQEFPTFGD